MIKVKARRRMAKQLINRMGRNIRRQGIYLRCRKLAQPGGAFCPVSIGQSKGLQKLPPSDNISAMSKVNKKLKAAAEKADLDWKDAMSKLEQIPWKIAAVPAKTLTKVSASTDPKAIIRQILAKNFPYATFELVFDNHRFANDANVILQERMLEAISKKYPSLKAACKIYFK
jgi:hypothetical protein